MEFNKNEAHKKHTIENMQDSLDKAKESLSSDASIKTSVQQSLHTELYSPLLDCLVIYTKLNRQPFSKEALIEGYPLKITAFRLKFLYVRQSVPI